MIDPVYCLSSRAHDANSGIAGLQVYVGVGTARGQLHNAHEGQRTLVGNFAPPFLIASLPFQCRIAVRHSQQPRPITRNLKR